MSILNVKTCVTTAFVIFFGWWFNSTVVPIFFPAFVGTPVAGFISIIASFIVWLVLAVLFWRHDKTVTKASTGAPTK